MNRYPEVRSFIKDEGHADSYENLKVNFIRGHNPDLVIFGDRGEEIERIDMIEYDLAGLHELVQQKGFQKAEVEL